MFRKFHRIGRNRTPRGLFVADLDQDNTFRVGYSLCCDTDIFNRKVAHEMAEGRMRKGETTTGEGRFKTSVNLTASFYDEDAMDDLRHAVPQSFHRIFDESVKFFTARKIGTPVSEQLLHA